MPRSSLDWITIMLLSLLFPEDISSKLYRTLQELSSSATIPTKILHLSFSRFTGSSFSSASNTRFCSSFLKPSVTWPTPYLSDLLLLHLWNSLLPHTSQLDSIKSLNRSSELTYLHQHIKYNPHL